MSDLAAFDVAFLRADNPGPLTLSGTNTWVAGRDPCLVVDPGPAIEGHLTAVAAEVERRGGAADVRVTHDHADHAEGAEQLRARVAAATVDAPTLPLPGHTPDHVVFLWRDRVCFTGDAVLGEGSVFVSGDLGAYLDGLRRLRALGLAVICPGHGPPVWDPAERLDGYIAHRLERERRLLDALARGLRDEDDLLDAVWSDAPPALRPAAALTLRAHLEKLRAEGRA